MEARIGQRLLDDPAVLVDHVEAERAMGAQGPASRSAERAAAPGSDCPSCQVGLELHGRVEADEPGRCVRSCSSRTVHRYSRRRRGGPPRPASGRPSRPGREAGTGGRRGTPACRRPAGSGGRRGRGAASGCGPGRPRPSTLVEQDLVLTAVPDPGPVLVGPAEAEREVRLVGGEDLVERAAPAGVGPRTSSGNSRSRRTPMGWCELSLRRPNLGDRRS